MRIMVLGCGGMGSGAVEQLVKYSDADVIAGDIEVEKARKLAARLGTDRISAQFIDVNDHKGLVSAIKTANPDVVASAVGPFYLYSGKVYKACIDAGVSCVDICDDPPGASEALALHEEAKEAGITIITGAGDSPGLTNIIAKYAADKLDRVDDVNVFWVASGRGIGLAQFYHAVRMWEHPYAYIDGKMVEKHGTIETEFPPPIGKIELSYCDHPEPYTIPRYVRAKNVRCAGALWPYSPLQDVEKWISLGMSSKEPIKVKGIDVVPFEFLTRFLVKVREKDIETWEENKIPWEFGATRVEAKGERGGEPTEYVFANVGRGGEAATPRTLATVAKMLAKGEIKLKGAYAPEGCVDPVLFMKEFSGGKLVFKETPYLHRVDITRV